MLSHMPRTLWKYIFFFIKRQLLDARWGDSCLSVRYLPGHIDVGTLLTSLFPPPSVFTPGVVLCQMLQKRQTGEWSASAF